MTSSASARTDIHRPSAPEFDPENYDLCGVFDLRPEWPDGRIEIVHGLVARGYSFSGAPHGSGQCSHCGTHIRYAALMLHVPTGTLLYIGETCLDGRFSETAAEFSTLRAAAAAQALVTRRANALNDTAAKIAAWLASDDADPRLVELSYRGNGGSVDQNYFLSDVAGKLFRYGSISARQAEAVANAITRDANRQARQDAYEAEKLLAADAPTGRIVVTGTVVSLKEYESDYSAGLVFKMLIKAAEGWTCFVTVPASINPLVGNRVRFTATLKVGDDRTHAKGSRPVKAEIL